VLASLFTACRDLSWVAPGAARRLAGWVERAYDVADWVTSALGDDPIGPVRVGLLDLQDALLAHDPDRIALDLEVARSIAEWQARRAAAPKTSGSDEPPLVDEHVSPGGRLEEPGTLPSDEAPDAR
jgi:hypothetical protein